MILEKLLLSSKAQRSRQIGVMALTPEKDVGGGPSVAAWAVGARARVREFFCVSVCLYVSVFSVREPAAVATSMRAPCTRTTIATV